MKVLFSPCLDYHLINELDVCIQVSAVSDQVGMQEFGANAADFDDDDGGGIVSETNVTKILNQKGTRKTKF
jgi:hypothetical protein